MIRLGATAGNGDAEIVMLDGTGYFMDHDLPALDPGSTYQLWAKVDDPDSPRMVSLGVLGADRDVVRFRLSAPRPCSRSPRRMRRAAPCRTNRAS